MNRLFKRIIKIIFLFSLKPYEYTWNGRMKYLFFNRKSNILAVIFSGMDADNNKRLYNYVRGLRSVRIDLLFLSDPYGYRGSYFWKEEGSDRPYTDTQSLIRFYMDKKKYSKVITLGSSKGGAAAILHGFEIGADYVIACANQFLIGSYLGEYPEIFKHMVGRTINKDDEDLLNDEFESIIKSKFKPTTKLHLIYSTEEPTYVEHTQPMIFFLNKNSIPHIDHIFEFRTHGEAGSVFKPFVYNFLTQIKQTTTNE